MRYSMMLIASRIAAILLVTTFTAAGAAKLIRHSGWRSALAGYGLPASWATPISFIVPFVELAVVAVFLFVSRSLGSVLSLVLLFSFSAAIARAGTTRGGRVPCGCFGSDRSRDYRWLLVRNGALALAAAVVLVADDGSPFVDELATAELVPLLFVTAGISLIAALASQMAGPLRGRTR